MMAAGPNLTKPGGNSAARQVFAGKHENRASFEVENDSQVDYHAVPSGFA